VFSVLFVCVPPQGIFPLHDVHIRKVKVLKKPKFDLARLLEVHGDLGSSTIDATGATVAHADGEFVEPTPLASI